MTLSQLESIRAARLQHLDHGDEAAAKALEWAVTAEPDLAALRTENKLKALVAAGTVMSNIAFNLKQRDEEAPIGQQWKGFLAEAQAGWDEAYSEYQQSLPQPPES